MKILYATDLHGSIPRYDAILRTAMENGVDVLHIGADLLPKGQDIYYQQKKFITGYLKDFFKQCSYLDLPVLSFFGNDDLYALKGHYKKYSTLLDETSFSKDGFEFKAYPYVQDYPFSLKTACKLDHEGWACPEEYLGPPVDYDEHGPIKIPDIKDHFLKKGTIENDLRKISADKKTIMAIHQPPWGLDLDVCIGGKRVGSKAVYDWADINQPLICLCGHIHESFYVTKVWKNKINNTTVIQPGQCPGEDRVRAVMIEVNGDGFISELLEFPTKGFR